MTTNTALRLARAHATGPVAHAVPELVGALTEGLYGWPAAAVLYFASSRYDPADLAGWITAAFPTAAVIGCSTAGEFTDAATGTGGISAIAFPAGVITRIAAALGELDADVVAGTQRAVARLERTLGAELRDLNPRHHVGFVLIDGLHGAEELVNETLGNAAPLLEFVGGSAGDDLAFDRTWVAVGEEVSYRGVALLVAECAVPFQVLKTCSFTPTGRVLTVTRADEAGRCVYELDGRPAAQAYADAVGVPVDALDEAIWMRHPLGLMIGGEPWIRSPQTVLPGGAIQFYAQLHTGMQVEVMAAGDLVGDTRRGLERVRAQLGGQVRGAVLFNCILRRLEMDDAGTGRDFVDTFRGIPAAGFHTYGETWLGHVNQTLTGVLFG
ncbi:MAG TPA: FIST N-terminal domain-containing protein [Kineosporiaceae bacterium]|nr:FIST N-terminal domain-containing protein [Kineosporiaceae bacterium]